jgi:hypothetical protein
MLKTKFIYGIKTESESGLILVIASNAITKEGKAFS